MTNKVKGKNKHKKAFFNFFISRKISLAFLLEILKLMIFFVLFVLLVGFFLSNFSKLQQKFTKAMAIESESSDYEEIVHRMIEEAGDPIRSAYRFFANMALAIILFYLLCIFFSIFLSYHEWRIIAGKKTSKETFARTTAVILICSSIALLAIFFSLYHFIINPSLSLTAAILISVIVSILSYLAYYIIEPFVFYDNFSKKLILAKWYQILASVFLNIVGLAVISLVFILISRFMSEISAAIFLFVLVAYYFAWSKNLIWLKIKRFNNG